MSEQESEVKDPVIEAMAGSREKNGSEERKRRKENWERNEVAESTKSSNDKESCELFQEETPHEVYSEDEEGKTIIWHLPRNNFTIMVLWSQFLVSASEIVVNGTQTGSFHLHLDKVDESWVQKLPALDYAVISTANWFFRSNYVYEGGHFLGCIYCPDPNVTHLGPDIVIQGAIRLALKSINDCNNCSRIVTLLRTFSPPQFENGTWNMGGTCMRTRPFAPEEINNSGLDLVYRNAQLAEIDNARKLGEEKGRAFDVIDVTEAMPMRPDGHPGLHWDNRWNKGLSDCIHWCLPGPVDTWNEFLLELLRRHSSFPLSSRRHASEDVKNQYSNNERVLNSNKVTNGFNGLLRLSRS
ncbi:xyloglucan O-acetyltransferase 3-like [Coffea arabica]|uniref:Xyloglucan O-acetyltransferase 3-like n=1 Tax=Coffea arabica TaxID=13443 RepID=A0ABM4VBV1_COFAR